MVQIPKQWLKYFISYDGVNLKNLVKFYVPTWSIFAGPVTNIKYVPNCNKILYHSFGHIRTYTVACNSSYCMYVLYNSFATSH